MQASRLHHEWESLMSIQFACSECKSKLEFVDGAAGTQRECPHCGRLIHVPEELPLVTPVPPKPAPERLPAVVEAPQTRRVRRRDDGDDDDREYREFVNKKTAAGILGILMGGLGIHKFILGFPTA